MKGFSNIESQENDGNVLGDTIIIRLAERPSSDGTQRKMKSGLIMISNAKIFRHQTETLTADLKYRISTRCPTQNIGNEVLQPKNIEVKQFYDVPACDRHVKKCNNKYVILILSDHHAQNTNTVSHFAEIPHIVVIYCCVSEASFNECIPRMSSKNQFSVLNSLPDTLMDPPIHYVDSTSQYVLVDLFFAELIRDVPQTEKTIEEFTEFCHSTYKNDPNYPTYVKQMEDFTKKYNGENAIGWYTKSDSFISRMVIKTCASLDFPALPKIGFFLRDMYIQLKKLHDEQLGKELKRGLVVYRGAIISKEEFESLKTVGALFFTRSFLSTTKNKKVAHMFSGKDTRNNTDDNKSVCISYQIDYVGLEERPIAFLGEYSRFRDEEEVMLSLGIVLRVKTCKKVKGDANYSWKIQMVRGENEAKIEKVFGGLYSLAQISASGVFLGMVNTIIHDGEHSGESGKLTTHPFKSEDTSTVEQPPVTSNHIESCAQVRSCLGIFTLFPSNVK
jgi:hypothetical protein